MIRSQPNYLEVSLFLFFVVGFVIVVVVVYNVDVVPTVVTVIFCLVLVIKI